MYFAWVFTFLCYFHYNLEANFALFIDSFSNFNQIM